RPANGSTANGINVSLRLTEFRFNALFAERVPRLRSLCRFYLLINLCSHIQVNFSINQHAEKLIERRAGGVPTGHSRKSELPYSVGCF
ncbi:MAG: hypothetical protein LBK94_13280, partial [Prevotellaceae bacterium]|nr:hypothetical protein [Prevotellaceae bacterium]